MSQSIYLVNYKYENDKLIDNGSEIIRYFPVSDQLLADVIKNYCEPRTLFEEDGEATGIVVLKNELLPTLLSKLKEMFLNKSKFINSKDIDCQIHELTMIGNIISLIELKESKFSGHKNTILSVG